MPSSSLKFRYAAGLFCAAACLLVPQASRAQTFSIAFSPATQTVTPGSSVTFSGSITNTSKTTAYYINGDGLDPLVSGLSTDDTPFVNTFQLGSPILLGAGQTYALTNLFTVTDTNAAPGTYSGQFDIYGGTALDSTDQSGFQRFTVNVPQAVPEASTSASFALLLLGGAAVIAGRRRKSAAA